MPDAMISNEDVKQAIDRLLSAKLTGSVRRHAPAGDLRQRLVVAREPIRGDSAEPATAAKLALYRSLNTPLPVSAPATAPATAPTAAPIGRASCRERV